MEEHKKDVSEYIAAIKQRKGRVVAISLIIMIITLVTALVWPPTYRSSATILIEQQDIPTDLVRSTVTSYASERIQTIQAQVMSRTNLLKIIEKFDLYAYERKMKTTGEIIERMREDTSLNIISAQVVDPRTGRPGSATIAFELSFDAEVPKSAQRVTSELTTLYLNENLKSRAKKADETSIFLNEETSRLGRNISELEKKLSGFKQQNAELLPNVRQINMQKLQRLESEFGTLSSNIQSGKEKVFYLKGTLSSLGVTSAGAADRLTLLEAEYASAKSRYSTNHPDLKRLEREIQILKNKSEKVITSGSENNEIVQLRTELLQLKEKYSDSHPDVIRATEKLKSLEGASNNDQKSLAKTGASDSDNPDPDNKDPSYISLKNQIAGMNIELRIAEDKKRLIKDEILELEDLLLRAPEVERQYLTLARDYENALMRYQETKAKGMQADVAKQLEVENKGERFTLIDPAAMPEKPIKPNRAAIIILGLFLSVSSGIGFAFISDTLSGVVRGAKKIENIVGVAPLSVIPLLLNAQDMHNKTRFKIRALMLFVFSIILIALLIHFFISPLDVLWYRISRKLEYIAG